jgi:hypothetical protein
LTTLIILQEGLVRQGSLGGPRGSRGQGHVSSFLYFLIHPGRARQSHMMSSNSLGPWLGHWTRVKKQTTSSLFEDASNIQLESSKARQALSSGTLHFCHAHHRVTGFGRVAVNGPWTLFEGVAFETLAEKSSTIVTA